MADTGPPTALAPRLTIYRTREIDADFYDALVARIAAKPKQPRGVLFHFSGAFEDEFFVVTVYRDTDAATTMFVDYTGPEVASMVAERGGPDLTRREFQVARYVIADVPESSLRILEPGEYIAVYLTDPRLTRDSYLQITEAMRFPQRMPVGLLLHVAGQIGDRWGIFDVWRTGSDLASFYRGRIKPTAEGLYPDYTTEMAQTNQIIQLHSLLIDDAVIGEDREFLSDA